MKKVLVLLLLVVLGMMVVSIMTSCVGAKPSIITKEEFDKIKPGMSYDEAVKIVGTPGTPVPVALPSSTGKTPPSQPTDVKQYEWKNGDKSSASVTFINNKMVNSMWTPAPE